MSPMNRRIITQMSRAAWREGGRGGGGRGEWKGGKPSRRGRKEGRGRKGGGRRGRIKGEGGQGRGRGWLGTAECHHTYHFRLLVLECQYRLFDWSADVRMSRCSLEIGGRKLGKLVV